MEAGKVFVTLGDMLAKGQEIKDGMEIPGLGVVHPDFQERNIIVDQLVELNKNTVDKLADLGL
jgi:simple sugar transport system substrate-binding protein